MYIFASLLLLVSGEIQDKHLTWVGKQLVASAQRRNEWNALLVMEGEVEKFRQQVFVAQVLKYVASQVQKMRENITKYIGQLDIEGHKALTTTALEGFQQKINDIIKNTPQTSPPSL
jgi:hypothetical protein